MNETTIYLIPEEVQKFIEFQKNYKAFMLLLDSGIFGIRNGSATLHFDFNGIIQRIERNDSLFDVRVKNTSVS